MIPIKIECQCGQRFAFDVEPIHGRMPAPVACPECGADGTAAANAILAQIAPAQPQYVQMATVVQPQYAQRVAVAAAPPPAGVRLTMPAAAQASNTMPPPIPASARPARPAQASPVRRPAIPQQPRGNDGWGADESSLNKLGMYIVMIPAVGAALITGGIIGIEVPVMILGIIVGVCGLIGGVVNLLGRGPVWAGALIGLVLGLGGYAVVAWWIHGRASVYKFELLIAFAAGAAPGFLLQYVLQQVLRKRARA